MKIKHFLKLSTRHSNFVFSAASSRSHSLSQPHVSSQASLQTPPLPTGPSNTFDVCGRNKRLFGFQAPTRQQRQLNPNKGVFGKKVKKKPTITRKFFCLANKDASKIATPGENITLKKASLGDKKITINLSANCQAVESIIKSYFPKHQMAGGYTFCTSNVTRHFEPTVQKD